MTTLLIATRNKHKVQEIRAILGDSFNYLTPDALKGTPSVVEDADTFEGNAIKKAVELAEWWAATAPSGEDSRCVLADDSGLEVDALHGAPGVHSARFAAMDTGAPGNSPDADNNAKLLRLLQAVPAEERTARFHCVIAWTPVPTPAPATAGEVCLSREAVIRTRTFHGTCEGTVGTAPRGALGFGYDPLFTPEGHDRTFAELGEDVKNGLSHRARALAKLKAWLEKTPA